MTKCLMDWETEQVMWPSRSSHRPNFSQVSVWSSSQPRRSTQGSCLTQIKEFKPTLKAELFNPPFNSKTMARDPSRFSYSQHRLIVRGWDTLGLQKKKRKEKKRKRNPHPNLKHLATKPPFCFEMGWKCPQM